MPHLLNCDIHDRERINHRTSVIWVNKVYRKTHTLFMTIAELEPLTIRSGDTDSNTMPHRLLKKNECSSKWDFWREWLEPHIQVYVRPYTCLHAYCTYMFGNHAVRNIVLDYVVKLYICECACENLIFNFFKSELFNW